MKQISLLKSGLWITLSNFATRFFALLSNLVLARLLQPSEFGVIAIAYVFWSFFTLFTQDTAGKFIVYKGTEDKRYLNTTYTVSLIVGVILALALIAAAPLIAQFFSEPSLSWVLVPYAFNLVLSSINYVYAGIMTSQMQYREMTNIGMIGSTVRLLSTIGAALLGCSYWSFAIGDTANWLVGSILLRYKSGHHLRLQLDPEVRSEVISYCLKITASNLGFYVNANIDNFTVGKLLGKASLGYYNLAYQLTMALSTVLNSVIFDLGMPVFAQQSDEQQQKDSLLKVVEQIAFLTTPIYALFFLVIDKQVISLTFGPNWVPICTVFPGLLIFAYFRVINSPLSAMLSVKGYPGVNAKVNLYIAPIAVIGFIIGAQNGGIVGVSIAVALVLGIGWTVLWWYLGCRALKWPMTKFLIPCFTAAIITFPGIAISFNLPTAIKPIPFILIYLICLRLIAPKLFAYYKSSATIYAKKMLKLRH